MRSLLFMLNVVENELIAKHFSPFPECQGTEVKKCLTARNSFVIYVWLCLINKILPLPLVQCKKNNHTKPSASKHLSGKGVSYFLRTLKKIAKNFLAKQCMCLSYGIIVQFYVIIQRFLPLFCNNDALNKPWAKEMQNALLPIPPLQIPVGIIPYRYLVWLL